MTIDELISILKKTQRLEINGLNLSADAEIYLETEFSGARSCQKLKDVLISDKRILLVSQEANEADPLFNLPTMPHLEIVKS